MSNNLFDRIPKNFIQAVMLTSQSFVDIVHLAQTNTKCYSVFRQNIYKLLIRHCLLDMKNICRYDIDSVRETNYLKHKYMIKYKSINIIKTINQDTIEGYKQNYSFNNFVKYIFQYNRQDYIHILNNRFDKIIVQEIKKYEAYYNGTFLLKKNDLKLREYIKYIFKYNLENHICTFIGKRYGSINDKAISGIIAGGHYHLLNYINPENVSTEYRRRAVKRNAQPVVDWIDKNLVFKCKCGNCYSSKYKKVMLSELRVSICNGIIEQETVNKAYLHGDTKVYLLLQKHNLIYKGDILENHLNLNDCFLMRVNTPPHTALKFLLSHIKTIEFDKLRVICEYYNFSKKEINSIIKVETHHYCLQYLNKLKDQSYN